MSSPYHGPNTYVLLPILDPAPSYSFIHYIHGYILYPTFPPTNKVASVHLVSLLLICVVRRNPYPTLFSESSLSRRAHGILPFT